MNNKDNNNDNVQAAVVRMSGRRMLQRIGVALVALGLLIITGCSNLQAHQANDRNPIMEQNNNDNKNGNVVQAAGLLSAPEGPGSVSGAPNLPTGFTDTFTSRFVQANGIRQHVVIGGEGPPLLLVHGWPETWYAWRLVMPALARDFEVIAVDQRGIGLSDTPQDGYDAGTLADDLVALMDALGHERFAVVGHDTGYIIGYALAADHPERVDRIALAEIPGPPLAPHSPPLFVPEPVNNRLWHIPFNRVNDELIVDMVSSHADAFYRYEFAIQGGGATLPEEAIDYYVSLYNRDKDVLRASFGLYRAWDATLAQNDERQNTLLTMPVLGIGGENSWGALSAEGMKPLADNVQSVIIPGTGHWVAEQAPDEMLAALTAFLAPYRDAAHTPTTVSNAVR